MAVFFICLAFVGMALLAGLVDRLFTRVRNLEYDDTSMRGDIRMCERRIEECSNRLNAIEEKADQLEAVLLGPAKIEMGSVTTFTTDPIGNGYINATPTTINGKPEMVEISPDGKTARIIKKG